MVVAAKLVISGEKHRHWAAFCLQWHAGKARAGYENGFRPESEAAGPA